MKKELVIDLNGCSLPFLQQVYKHSLMTVYSEFHSVQFIPDFFFPSLFFLLDIFNLSITNLKL